MRSIKCTRPDVKNCAERDSRRQTHRGAEQRRVTNGAAMRTFRRWAACYAAN